METKNKVKDEPAAARYCVRIETEQGLENISVGSDLNREIAFAEEHHARHGCKTWVFNIWTDRTVLRLERVERVERAAGGAA